MWLSMDGFLGYVAIIVFLIMAGVKYAWWHPLIMLVSAIVITGTIGRLLALILPSFLMAFFVSILEVGAIVATWKWM